MGGTGIRNVGKDSDPEMEAITNYWKELVRRVPTEGTGMLTLSPSALGL